MALEHQDTWMSKQRGGNAAKRWVSTFIIYTNLNLYNPSLLYVHKNSFLDYWKNWCLWACDRGTVMSLADSHLVKRGKKHFYWKKNLKSLVEMANKLIFIRILITAHKNLRKAKLYQLNIWSGLLTVTFPWLQFISVFLSLL